MIKYKKNIERVCDRGFYVWVENPGIMYPITSIWNPDNKNHLFWYLGYSTEVNGDFRSNKPVRRLYFEQEKQIFNVPTLFFSLETMDKIKLLSNHDRLFDKSHRFYYYTEYGTPKEYVRQEQNRKEEIRRNLIHVLIDDYVRNKYQQN